MMALPKGSNNLISRFQTLLSNPLQILYLLPAILIGMTVHEWAHAFAAYKLGDPTARNLGRMTLNPLAHIDPFGFLCLLLAGFGWARPVPINTRNFKNYKRDEIIVSVAGIAMNLVTALVAVFLLCIGAQVFGLWSNEAFMTIFYGIVSINLSLAVFNLLPFYPLDGSHIFECLLGHRFPKFFLFMHQYGQYILIVLLLTGTIGSVLSYAVSGIMSGYLRLAYAVIGLF